MRLFILTFLIALSPFNPIAAKDGRPYVAVVGVGEASMMPDQLVITISFSELDKTADAARLTLNEKLNTLITLTDALKDKTQVTSSGVSVALEYEYNQNDRRRILVGYRANQTVTIIVDGVADGGELHDQIISAFPKTSSNTAYKLANTDRLIEKARLLAVEDARRRASLYADVADQRLGRALIIEESGLDSQRLQFDLQDKVSRLYVQSEAAGGDLVVTGSRAAFNEREKASSGQILLPDALKVSISLYAKFALIKK